MRLKLNFKYIRLLFLSALAGSFFVGVWAEKWNLDRDVSSCRVKEIRESGSFKFINRLLTCEVGKQDESSESKNLQLKIKNIIKKDFDKGLVEKASVYFFSPSDAHWVGVNEDEKFIPASLLKVPIMITYLKLVQNNSSLFSEKFIYEDSNDYNKVSNFKPSVFITPGKSYSLKDLVEYMIKYSDNNAMELLVNTIDNNTLQDFYAKTYDLFDIKFSEQQENFITARSYSYFFRILYNATYLNRQDSEYALSLLAQTDFKAGLVAGIPSDIVIAHKFGERTLLDFKGQVLERELHDCGIVYYPLGPYVICVMTRGKEFKDLSNAIRDISAAVYEDVRSGFK